MALEPINKAAYEVLSAMPEDEAQLILSAIVYDTLPQYIEECSPVIQQHVDTWVSKRLGAYDRYLKRQYVERVKKNEPIDDLEQIHALISKAWDPQEHARGGDKENPGRFSRSWGPGANMAGPRGATSAWGRTITFTRPTVRKPIRNPEAAGVPEWKDASLSAGQRADLQAAYMQLKNQLGEYDRAGVGGDVKIELQGSKGTKIIAGTDIDAAFAEIANTSGVKMPTRAVISLPYATVGGTYFDALSSLPGGVNRPDLVLNTMGAVQGLPSAIGTGSQFQRDHFDNSYALSANEPRFRRLKSGVDVIDSFVPASAARTKAAMAGAKYVGDLGPDAEKIIGPTARKLTYRSRGTERKSIDPALAEIDAANHSTAIVGTVQGGVRAGKARYLGMPGLIPQYFQDRLPKKDYWELQRKSGAVPPSEGVIIDSTGKIVSQSVGFKDDHFLPFTIKGLAKMRGGEYVRTRSTGGPTTEDIYTALIGGATGFTVVSRSGTFTVEFDESFKGRRRYNDKAGKMVERYGKLLDAAGSGEVTLNDVDPKRAAELDAQARREAPTDPKAYEARRRQLFEREKVMPSPAAGDEQEIKRRLLQDLKEEVAGGETTFAKEIQEAKLASAKNIAANRRLAEQYNFEYSAPDPAEADNAIAQMINAEVERRYPEAEKREMAERSYRAMRLDGQGYHSALQSLQEQYPYYIKRVVWHPAEDPTHMERDKGYVKPRFNRPDEVWEGYFDPSIAGAAPNTALASQMARHEEGAHGKIRASGTNYQNWSQMKGRLQPISTPEAKTTPEGAKATSGATTEATPRRVPMSAGDAALIAAVESSLQMKRKMPDGSVASISPRGEIEGKEFGEGWSQLAGIDLDDIRGEMSPILRDPAKREKLVTSLERVRSWAQTNAGDFAGDANYAKFSDAMKSVRRTSGDKKPFTNADDAIGSPSKLFSFPDIDAMERPTQLSDEAKNLEAVMTEIVTYEGDSPDAKITNFIRMQQNKYDRALKDLSADDPEPPAVQEALKKTEKAHRLRALIQRAEELKAQGMPINEQWVTGGPSAASSTVVQRSLGS